MSHSMNLGPFPELEKLKSDGTNFTLWIDTLRKVLTTHNMTYVLETAPVALSDSASMDEKNVFKFKEEESTFVKDGMLNAMDDVLKQRFENMSAYEIITDVKAAFYPIRRHEMYDISRMF